MPATPAQVEANRKNAARSTGPKTDQGKQRSRGNAFKHGLCASVIGSDPAPASEGPDQFGDWLVKQVTRLGNQVEQAQLMQEVARDKISLRAELVWDDDRRLEVTILGDRLSIEPGETVEKLRQTPQGCQWLMARWAMLAHAADHGRGWTPEQSSLAFDLLGTPFAFRQGNDPGTRIDLEGQVDGPVGLPSELARREIADLKQRFELVQELDAADRQVAEAGLIDDAEIRRLRRYEAAIHRRLQWTIKLLEQAAAQAPPVTPSFDAPEAGSPPIESEIPKVKPPAGPPTRSTTRAEKKLIKAEARRQAKIRAMEKLRA